MAGAKPAFDEGKWEPVPDYPIYTFSRPGAALQREMINKSSSAYLREESIYELLGRTFCAISMPPSRLRVEPEDA